MLTTKNQYSYKGKFREGVVFAFYKDGKILIEHRPDAKGGTGKDVFFTNGSIEMKDHGKDQDYRIVAHNREVNEEFDGNIVPTDTRYLGELEVPEINLVFYVYLTLGWEGTMPAYTIEEGKKFADLEWIELDRQSEYFKYPSAFTICDMIGKYIV